ncbi:MAG: SNF2-related protein, partial [Planctomycetales bacterium]
MSLADRCSHAFPQDPQSQGEQLFTQRIIQLGDMDSEYLDARIQQGPREYHYVSLEWFLSSPRQPAVEIRCTCEPFVEQKVSCEHVWATILLADSQGWDGFVPGSGPVELIHVYQDVQEEEDEGAGDGSLGSRPEELLDVLQIIPGMRAARQWEDQLEQIRAASEFYVTEQTPSRGKPQKQRQAWFVLKSDVSRDQPGLNIEFHHREMRKNGTYGKLKAIRIGEDELPRFHDPADRELLGLLISNVPEEEGSGAPYTYRRYWGPPKYSSCLVGPALYDYLLPKLCATGRFGWLDENNKDRVHSLTFDDGPAWQLRLRVQPIEDGKKWEVWGCLERGDQTVELDHPRVLTANGIAIFPESIVRFNAMDSFGWIAQFSENGPIQVPAKQGEKLLERIWKMPSLPQVDLPDELEWKEVASQPVPKIVFTPCSPHDARDLGVDVAFDYDGKFVGWRDSQGAIIDSSTREVVRRDRDAERKAVDRLMEEGLTVPTHAQWSEKFDFTIPAKQLPGVIRELSPLGWRLEAQGKAIRSAGRVSFSVSSNIDWFELDGKVDFDGVSASIPALLAAAARGDQLVSLDDGSQGLLPEDWLKKYAPLAQLGKAKGDKLEFAATQAAILDVLLAAQPEVNVDAQFEEARDRLRSFDGVAPITEPPGFEGELREYQREGLGWLHFLREFRFGGCLADDMGLGKTIQVLALLLARRNETKPEDRKPSLVVVPRSLVHNWIDEANRFTPALTVLEYSGTRRAALLEKFPEYDLIVTTYGTMRRDIAKLKDVALDYTIL